MAIERMVVRGDRLQVEPRLRQIKTTVCRVIIRSGRDGLVNPDQGDKKGEIDDGGPEGDLGRAESEGVLHGVEVGLKSRLGRLEGCRCEHYNANSGVARIVNLQR